MTIKIRIDLLDKLLLRCEWSITSARKNHLGPNLPLISELFADNMCFSDRPFPSLITNHPPLFQPTHLKISLVSFLSSSETSQLLAYRRWFVSGTQILVWCSWRFTRWSCLKRYFLSVVLCLDRYLFIFVSFISLLSDG